jgi:lariat debranching enzyme
MRIAIEGCTHGELDKTYETILAAEKESGKKVDLLLCCGDFQSTRNLADLKCMAVPDKYKDMCTFYKYYSGEKKAPVLTVFIGGNHEASNFLQELPYGGWVAPNIYYAGYATVITINGGLRIGGLSGIYKGCDYLKGHYEFPPYTDNSIRSVYHIRNLETFRLKQLSSAPPDVMLSHDWPRGIYHHGDVDTLLRWKRHFHDDIANNQLGSRPTEELLDMLKPEYWFSAHLHVKFPALVEHADGRKTKFLALDKCLPKRKFLQILDMKPALTGEEKVRLEYDPAWLAVLKSTKELLSVDSVSNHMPGPGYGGRHNFAPTEADVAEVIALFDGDLVIPENFEQTAPPFNPDTESLRDMHSMGPHPGPQKNPQTELFCSKLGIVDPCELAVVRSGRQMISSGDSFCNASASDEKSTFLSMNNDEIALDDDDDDDEDDKSGPDVVVEKVEAVKRLSLILPAPKNEEDEDAVNPDLKEVGDFVVDAIPEPTNLDSGSNQETTPGSPKRKVLKRRNQAIYSQEDD